MFESFIKKNTVYCRQRKEMSWKEGEGAREPPKSHLTAKEGASPLQPQRP